MSTKTYFPIYVVSLIVKSKQNYNLTPKQAHYAAMDVWCSLQLHPQIVSSGPDFSQRIKDYEPGLPIMLLSDDNFMEVAQRQISNVKQKGYASKYSFF